MRPSHLAALLVLALAACTASVPAHETAGTTSSSSSSGSSSSGSSSSGTPSTWSRGFATQLPHDYARLERVAVNAAGTTVVSGHYGGVVSLDGVAPSTPGLPSSGGSFLASFDAAGALRWAKATPQLERVGIDAAGNIVVATHFLGTIDLGGGPLVSAGERDLAVARLDPDGNLLWSERFGDAGDQDISSVAVTAAGEIVIAGGFGGTLDVGTGPLVSAGTGATSELAARGDVYVAKLDTSGKAMWATHYGVSVADTWSVEAEALVTVGEAGEIALVVSAVGVALGAPWNTPSTPVRGAYVAELDASGAPLWGLTLEGSAAEVDVQSVALGPAGDVLLCGEIGGQLAFGEGSLSAPGAERSAFVAVVDASGAPRWARAFAEGVDPVEGVNGAAFDAQGDIVLACNYRGMMDFGAGPLGNDASPAVSIAIASFDPAGKLLESHTLGGEAAGGADGVALGGLAAIPGGAGLILGGAYGGPLDLGQGALPVPGPPIPQEDLGTFMFLARVAF